jgi:hypothetical protein
MKQAVYGIVNTAPQANAVVERLVASGFLSSDISVLFPDTAGTRDFEYEKSTKAPEGAAAGGVAGLGVGGALGLLAGIGALAIPGIGPFVAAGPIMAALSGAAVGGAAGGIIGGLVGLGMPEYEAKQYEGNALEIYLSPYIPRMTRRAHEPSGFLSSLAPRTSAPVARRGRPASPSRSTNVARAAPPRCAKCSLLERPQQAEAPRLPSPLLENAAQDNSHRLSAVAYSIFSQTRQKRSRSLDVIGRSLQLARSMGCACRSPSWKIFSNCSPVLLPMTTASTSSLKSTLR